MGKKTAYDKLKDEITAAVQKSHSSRHSQSDYTKMTMSLLNEPEQEVPVYVSDPDTPVITKPVQAYRDSLKSVLKQFGVDDAEMDRIQQVKFGKDHAKAFNDLAAVSIKDYTSTGRKLVLPITSPTETQMEIAQVTKPEKSEDTRKPVENPDGTYSSVPTGKRKTTAEHSEMKVSNKMPAWLVSEQML